MARLRDMEGVTRGGDILRIDPRVISVDPGYNIRQSGINPEADSELAESIRLYGVRTPVVVRKTKDGNLVIVQGHRRLGACMRLISEGVELARIPALMEDPGTDEFDRQVDLLRSNSGLPLTPLEQALGIKRFVDFGWTDEEIAKRLGWSTATVLNRKILLRAPAEVKALVAEGVVSASRAIDAIRVEGNERASEVLISAPVSRKGRPKGSKNLNREAPAKPLSDVSIRDIERLVNGLRWIAANDGPEGKMAAHANKILSRCGLLGSTEATEAKE